MQPSDSAVGKGAAGAVANEKGEASLAEKAYVALEVRHIGVGVFAGQQIATGDLAACQSEVLADLVGAFATNEDSEHAGHPLGG